jgi:hypothetical protein
MLYYARVYTASVGCASLCCASVNCTSLYCASVDCTSLYCASVIYSSFFYSAIVNTIQYLVSVSTHPEAFDIDNNLIDNRR